MEEKKRTKVCSVSNVCSNVKIRERVCERKKLIILKNLDWVLEYEVTIINMKSSTIIQKQHKVLFFLLQHKLTCNTLTRMQFIRLIYWISLLYVKFQDEPQELSREVRNGAHRKLAEGERGEWTNKEECAEVALVLAGRPELGWEGGMLWGLSPRWDEMQTSQNSEEWSGTLCCIFPWPLCSACTRTLLMSCGCDRISFFPFVAYYKLDLMSGDKKPEWAFRRACNTRILFTDAVSLRSGQINLLDTHTQIWFQSSRYTH